MVRASTSGSIINVMPIVRVLSFNTFDRNEHLENPLTSIKDSCSALYSQVNAVYTDTVQASFPESLRVDVRKSNQGVCNKFGGIKSTGKKEEKKI
jgi:hypothetical protein